MTPAVTYAKKIDLRLILLALAITVTQITFATLSARGETWRDRYMSLWTFDGGWYALILETGYRTTDPPDTTDNASNVAFFPAYPLLARGLWTLSGWSPAVSLLITAQFSALVFWWAMLRHLKIMKISPSISASAIMVTFSHPAAFYLIVTYADSLFMASFLLLLLWGYPNQRSFALILATALAGYMTSAARIVGAPLAALPVIWAWNDLRPALKKPWQFGALLRGIWPHVFISFFTAFGTISFFLYCAIRFGHWDLYMRTRAAGWKVFETDYLAIFAYRNFRIRMPRFDQSLISPLDVSHLYVAVIILAVFIIPIADYWISRRNKVEGFAQRVPLYLGAWLLLFFSASGAGLAHGSYLGFLRYGFYSHVPLVLAVVQAHRQLHPTREVMSLWLQIIVFLACALGLALQTHFCYLFTHAIMVS